MELHDFVGHGQPDPGPGFLGSEVKIVNLIANLVGNAAALVTNLDQHFIVVFRAADAQGSSLGHGLHSIEDNIQKRLLEQIGIGAHQQGHSRKLPINGHALTGGIGRGQLSNIIQQFANVQVRKTQFHGTGEIYQHLHHAVEALDLTANYIHVPAGGGIDLLQFLAKQLKMHHDGIDGIFDFVSYAGGKPADGRKAVGELDLVFDAAHGFGIAQGQQGADALAALLDEIETQKNAPAVFHLHLALRDGHVRSKTI